MRKGEKERKRKSEGKNFVKLPVLKLGETLW